MPGRWSYNFRVQAGVSQGPIRGQGGRERPIRGGGGSGPIRGGPSAPRAESMYRDGPLSLYQMSARFQWTPSSPRPTIPGGSRPGEPLDRFRGCSGLSRATGRFESIDRA